MRTHLSIILFCLYAATGLSYDRCDDLCRVIGFVSGGACNAEQKCLCKPLDYDATAYLPSVCEAPIPSS